MERWLGFEEQGAYMEKFKIPRADIGAQATLLQKSTLADVRKSIFHQSISGFPTKAS